MVNTEIRVIHAWGHLRKYISDIMEDTNVEKQGLSLGNVKKK